MMGVLYITGNAHHNDGRFFVLRIGNNFFGGLKMKTIESLINASKKVYVRMCNMRF